MGRRQAADVNEIADLAMTAECRVVYEDYIVAHDAVVADMRIRHEEAALSDPRFTTALTVPTFIVTHSRIVQPSPISSVVGSPR